MPGNELASTLDDLASQLSVFAKDDSANLIEQSIRCLDALSQIQSTFAMSCEESACDWSTLKIVLSQVVSGFDMPSECESDAFDDSLSLLDSKRRGQVYFLKVLLKALGGN